MNPALTGESPRTALVDWAFKVLGQPFEWGSTDCTALALQAAAILTGRADIWTRWQGRWWDVRSAARCRRTADLATTLAAEGFVQAPGHYAPPGAILVGRRGWRGGHVVLGRRAVSSRPECGVALFKTRAILEVGAEVWGLPDVGTCLPKQGFAR
jgi:hypothetical protein